MKKIHFVTTGEVKISTNDTILKSTAIGSCVAIAAYDANQKVGGLAHVMVPGKAPLEKNHQKTIYAANAIEEMIRRMVATGAKRESIEVCLVGGGNVLQRKDGTIGLNNLISIIDILKKKSIKVKAKSVGGTERRSMSLDVANGSIYYSVGDGKEKLLWNAKRK